VLLFIAVCLVAVNLRMTITGVGPLLEEIADDRGVDVSTLGALASVPLLAWGLFSSLAHGISTRFGMIQTIAGALVVLMIATVWRSMPGWSANLWIGTAITGFGLAIGNALMPAVIKRDFGSRVPLVMGIYTAMMGGIGAAASGYVVPISQLAVGGEPLGWRMALLLSGSLLPVALVVWLWANRRSLARRAAGLELSPSAAARSSRAGRRIWGDPLAWTVSIYMGCQSACFYIMAAWLAPYLTSLELSPVTAGIDLMVYQFVGILGSLMLPLLLRGRLTRWAPVILPALGISANAGFLLVPSAIPFWLVLGGFNVGASLTMALTLMATRARTTEASSALSGMAQSVGYLIAAVGPTVFGWLHGWSDGWVAPFSLLWLMALVQLVAGIVVGKERFVLDPARRK